MSALLTILDRLATALNDAYDGPDSPSAWLGSLATDADKVVRLAKKLEAELAELKK